MDARHARRRLSVRARSPGQRRAWPVLDGDRWGAAGLHAFAFVALPSLPYALLLLDYGLWPRTPLILLYWLVGVWARRSWTVGCAMAVVACLDLMWLTSALTPLHPLGVADALPYLPLITPSASWLYLAMGAAALAAVGLPAALARRAPRMFRRRQLSACLMVAAVAADLYVAVTGLRADPPFAQAPATFDSAMRQAGIERSDAVAAGGSLLVVMVEHLGAFADPAHGERLLEALLTAEVASRYRVRTGATPYAGMTIGAASRELCGRWAARRDDLLAADADCLPARLRARGYDTHAVHAFTGRMFDRFDWYPRIGFEHLLFEEQLRARGVSVRCGTVFVSACDREAANVVRELLTGPGDRPRFVYWLTVDTHTPFDPGSGSRRWDCSSGGPFGDRTVCLLARIWADVLEATGRIAADPALRPGTTVLVVGDHPPVAVSRAAARYFARGIVPWIALEPRTPTLSARSSG